MEEGRREGRPLERMSCGEWRMPGPPAEVRLSLGEHLPVVVLGCPDNVSHVHRGLNGPNLST